MSTKQQYTEIYRLLRLLDRTFLTAYPGNRQAMRRADLVMVRLDGFEAKCPSVYRAANASYEKR